MQLSDKQKEFWNNSTHRWNIKAGAVRSGKTYLDYFLIPKRIRACTGSGLILLLGNTKSTLERNILEPMRNLLGSGLVGSISSNNTVYLFGKRCHALGADKVNQVTKIQGAGFEYVYGDEVTTWHPEVFNMLKSRIDKPNSKFDGTCNPDNPNHWFKLFLDSDADIYLQNYNIDDNPFNDRTYVENLKKEYRGTVFYDRFILGKWVAAEGIIYRRFADDPNKFIIESPPTDIMFATIGIDFGGNKSAQAFNCTGFTANFKQVVTLDEYHTKDPLDPERLQKVFAEFVRIEMSKYVVTEAFADSAEQVLIRGLQNTLIKEGIPLKIHNAKKGSINERIRFYTLLHGAGRYKIMKHCKNTIEAFSTALWNSKKYNDERLDDGTVNVDSLDAQEYSTEKYQDKIIKLITFGG